MSATIHVVSGLAHRGDGTVLFGKRKAGGLRPGLWELPGGKVEPGEDPSHALKREWREELGIKLVAMGECIARCTLDVEVKLRVDLYPVEIRGEPQLLDHEQLSWMTPLFAVQRRPCSPAFYLHFALLREHMQRINMWVQP